jgi:hypothetical protein
VLLGHDFAWLRSEFGTDLATPRAVFESLSRPSRFLNRRNILPGLVVARAVAMVQRIKKAKPLLTRDSQNLQSGTIGSAGSYSRTRRLRLHDRRRATP